MQKTTGNNISCYIDFGIAVIHTKSILIKIPQLNIQCLYLIFSTYLMVGFINWKASELVRAKW